MLRFLPKALIFLCLGISAAFANPQTPVSELKVGGTVSLSVPSRNVQELRLIAGSAEAVELVIEQDAPDLQLSVIGPDNDLLRRIRPGTTHKLSLSFPTASPGPFILQIQSHPLDLEKEAGTIIVAAEAVGRPDLITRTRAEDAYLKAQELLSAAELSSLQRSDELFGSAREKWQSIGDLGGQVLALEGEGDARLARSEFRLALDAYGRAERLLGPDASELASVLNGESRVYLEWWKSTPAMEFAERALKSSRSHHDVTDEAEALANRAESLYLVTQDDAADQDLNSALALTEDTGQKRLRARILRCKAWIEEDRGHLTRASSLMERSDELFRQAGAVRASLNNLSDLATLSGMQGDHYTAMLRHSKLARALRNSGDVAGAAFSLDNLGTDYSELNRYAEAVRYYASAKSLFASIHHSSGLFISLGHLCLTDIRLNRPASAMRYCSASRALAREIGDPKREGIAEWHMAKASLALGKAEAAAEGFKRAASISEGVKDSRFEALSLVDMGIALEKLERRDEARELYRQAEELSREAEDPGGQIEARFHRAEVDSELGRKEDSKDVLSGSMQLIEAQRRLIADDRLRSSYFEAAKKSYELYIQLLMDERRERPDQELNRAALELSEATHARSLLDAVMSSGGRGRLNGTSVVPADLIKMHGEIEFLYDQRLKLMLAGDSRLLAENATKLARVLDEYDRATDALNSPANHGPAGNPLAAPDLVEKSRQSGQAYIEYAVGDKESFAWVLNRGILESYVLPPKQQIATAVRRWKSLVESRAMRPGDSFNVYKNRVATAGKELPEVSASLSCMLFANFLQEEMTDLVIVPDDILDGLPFSALPVQGCKKGTHPSVMQEHDVTYTPSLSIYFAQKDGSTTRHFNGEIALLADPVFDASDSRVPSGKRGARGNLIGPVDDSSEALSRLAGSRAEALSIAALFPPSRVQLRLDFNASLASFLRGDMSGYRIWHLATHGIADPGSSDFSGLVLSLVDPRGTPVYGYLYSREIAQLRIDADLVVLSSCSSGFGAATEGVASNSIAYAFLQSGVKRVISTLWSVDDDASRDLMLSFYRHLVLDREEPQRALREAQLNLLRNPRFANPYYWAGYVLTASTE